MYDDLGTAGRGRKAHHCGRTSIHRTGGRCAIQGQVYRLLTKALRLQLVYSDHCSACCFVTRLKSNAGIQPSSENKPCSIPSNRRCWAITLISFKHRRPGGKPLNEVPTHPVVAKYNGWSEKTGRPLDASSTTWKPSPLIAERYKARWALSVLQMAEANLKTGSYSPQRNASSSADNLLL